MGLIQHYHPWPHTMFSLTVQKPLFVNVSFVFKDLRKKDNIFINIPFYKSQSSWTGWLHMGISGPSAPRCLCRVLTATPASLWLSGPQQPRDACSEQTVLGVGSWSGPKGLLWSWHTCQQHLMARIFNIHVNKKNVTYRQTDSQTLGIYNGLVFCNLAMEALKLIKG